MRSSPTKDHLTCVTEMAIDVLLALFRIQQVAQRIESAELTSDLAVVKPSKKASEKLLGKHREKIIEQPPADYTELLEALEIIREVSEEGQDSISLRTLEWIDLQIAAGIVMARNKVCQSRNG